MEIRVAIFDDHNGVLNGLNQLISFTPGLTVVGLFQNTQNLIKKVEKSAPDVILMDIQMDESMDGIQATLELKKTFPELRIIIQTVFEDDDKIFAAICAGASGYLLKSSPPTRYIEAIQEAYQGGAPMSSGIASKVLAMFRNQSQPIEATNDQDLSLREKEILQYLVKGHSYKMIADACFISYDTVRFHIKNIYHKLHVHSMTEAVSKAIKRRLV